MMMQRILLRPPTLPSLLTTSHRLVHTSQYVESKASKTRGKIVLKSVQQFKRNDKMQNTSLRNGTGASASLFEVDEKDVKEDDDVLRMKEIEAAKDDPVQDTVEDSAKGKGFEGFLDKLNEVPDKGEPRPEPEHSYTPEETIYTSSTPFNVPLLMTACFAFATFSLSAADMAANGYSAYNEEKEEYELASKWKRYTFSGGFLVVATGLVLWGTLAPGRIITKLTISRPTTSTSPFSPHSIISIHTPITKLPGLGKARQVPLHAFRLLGPISEGPRSWHPRHQIVENRPKRNDPISRFGRRLSKLLIADTTSLSTKSTTWSSKSQTLSHVPLLVLGDRFNYTLCKKRSKDGSILGAKDGAWCSDWEGLEKAWLDAGKEGYKR